MHHAQEPAKAADEKYEWKIKDKSQRIKRVHERKVRKHTRAGRK